MTMQMINEARDSLRYGYATGWAHLVAVADRVSVLAYEGKFSPANATSFTITYARCSAGLIACTGKAAISSPLTATPMATAAAPTATAARSTGRPPG